MKKLEDFNLNIIEDSNAISVKGGMAADEDGTTTELTVGDYSTGDWHDEGTCGNS